MLRTFQIIFNLHEKYLKCSIKKITPTNLNFPKGKIEAVAAQYNKK